MKPITLENTIKGYMELLKLGRNSKVDIIPYLFVNYPDQKLTQKQLRQIEEFTMAVDRTFRQDESASYSPSYAQDTCELGCMNYHLLVNLGKQPNEYIKFKDRDLHEINVKEFELRALRINYLRKDASINELVKAFYASAALLPPMKDPNTFRTYRHETTKKVLTTISDRLKDMPVGTEGAVILSSLKSALMTPYRIVISVDERFMEHVIYSMTASTEQNYKDEIGLRYADDFFPENFDREDFTDEQLKKLEKGLNQRIETILHGEFKSENNKDRLYKASSIITHLQAFDLEPDLKLYNEIADTATEIKDAGTLKRLNIVKRLEYQDILNITKEKISWAYINPSTNMESTVRDAVDLVMQFEEGLKGLSDRDIFKASEHLDSYKRIRNEIHRDIISSEIEKRRKDAEQFPNIILTYKEYIKGGIYDSNKTIVLGPKELEELPQRTIRLQEVIEKKTDAKVNVVLLEGPTYLAFMQQHINNAIVFTGQLIRNPNYNDAHEAKKYRMFFNALNLANTMTQQRGFLTLAWCGCGDENMIRGIGYNYGARIENIRHIREGESMLKLLPYVSDYKEE